MQPRTRLVAELERRLEQAERAESERPSPEQVKALALRMAEQRAQAENPTQDTKRPSGAPQAPSSPEPAERPQERPQARETPPQAPQEPPKPIRTKKALTDRFKTRLDERLAENERKQAEKQAEQRQIDPWQAQPPQRRGHGR